MSDAGRGKQSSSRRRISPTSSADSAQHSEPAQSGSSAETSDTDVRPTKTRTSRIGGSSRRGSRRTTTARDRRKSPTSSGSTTSGSARKKSSRSKPEEMLARRLESEGISHEAEFRFHPTRKWRFDFALTDAPVAIEVEGGVFSRGRHTRPGGFIADCEKYNAATALGWRVLRVVPTKNWLDETVSLIHAVVDMIGFEHEQIAREDRE